MRHALLIAYAVGFAAGCAGSHAELPLELAYSLPRDERVAIYDAENDVVIAKSREDDARREIEKLKRDLDDLSDRWDHAKERMEKTHADRVVKVRAVFDAKGKFLGETLDIAETALGARRAQTAAANARLELVRARQLVRLGSLPEAKLKAFESEVEVREKAAKDADKKETDMRIEAQKSFTAWKDAEDAYARGTGDFDTLVWVD